MNSFRMPNTAGSADQRNVDFIPPGCRFPIIRWSTRLFCFLDQACNCLDGSGFLRVAPESDLDARDMKCTLR